MVCQWDRNLFIWITIFFHFHHLTCDPHRDWLEEINVEIFGCTMWSIKLTTIIPVDQFFTRLLEDWSAILLMEEGSKLQSSMKIWVIGSPSRRNMSQKYRSLDNFTEESLLNIFHIV